MNENDTRNSNQSDRKDKRKSVGYKNNVGSSNYSGNKQDSSEQGFDEEFLVHIFESCDDGGEEAQAYPLLDVPDSLSAALYEIPKTQGVKRNVRKKAFPLLAMAASTVLAFVLVSHYQNVSQQARDLQQAQHDLRLAFTYINKANEQASSHIRSTISHSLQKATIEPVMQTMYDI
ncbi:MAG: hypothetical protein ACI93R_002982 [Flavobacteriales bacterium]|jgi:hypothetical protein